MNWVPWTGRRLLLWNRFEPSIARTLRSFSGSVSRTSSILVAYVVAYDLLETFLLISIEEDALCFLLPILLSFYRYGFGPLRAVVDERAICCCESFSLTFRPLSYGFPRVFRLPWLPAARELAWCWLIGLADWTIWWTFMKSALVMFDLDSRTLSCVSWNVNGSESVPVSSGIWLSRCSVCQFYCVWLAIGWCVGMG